MFGMAAIVRDLAHGLAERKMKPRWTRSRDGTEVARRLAAALTTTLRAGHQEPAASHENARASRRKNEDHGEGQERAQAPVADGLFGSAVDRVQEVVHVATIGNLSLADHPPLVRIRHLVTHLNSGGDAVDG
jgi:hypothetical protein